MKKSHSRAFRISILMFILTLIPLGEFFILHKEIGHFKKTTGIIVGSSPTQCGSTLKSECWYRIIEYKINENQTHKIRSEAASTLRQIGKTQSVLVNPANVYDAREGGFTGVWLPLTLHSFLVFGFLVFIVMFYAQDFLAVKNSISKKLKKLINN